MKLKLTYLMLWVCTLGCSSHKSLSLRSIEKAVPVFVAGQDEYLCYRIPAIVKTKSGDLLAFAEGRKRGCSDTGDIDLVMKRSRDRGNTWSQLEVIWDDYDNTCGNPAPIVDKQTGNIILLSTWNLGEDHESEIIAQTSQDTRRIFVLKSFDEGNRWTQPHEITEDVKLSSWTWYATGPGSGIQLSQGSKRGRLLLGCDHIEAESKKYYSHSIYSDDGGTTWMLGGSSAVDQVNECEIVERSDGKLMMNMRNYDREQKTRQIALSHDQGLTWVDQQHIEQLIEPICQAGFHGHNRLLLFSNPASSEERINMTLKVSFDDGASWPESMTLHAGPSAYSDLVSLDKKNIGCLFESGSESPYERIVFQSISLK